MIRLLPDTNIYGLVAADADLHDIHIHLEGKDFKFCGFDIVRRELRQAPKKAKNGQNIRTLLLHAYDQLVSKEYVTTDALIRLADEYHGKYLQLGGGYTREKLFNDFLIVACASQKQVDVLVSEDNATMLNELARKSYTLVNASRGLPMPKFIGYKLFKEMILGTGLPNPFINSTDKFGVFLCFFYLFPGAMFHGYLGEREVFKCSGKERVLP